MGRKVSRHFARKPLITLFSLCNPPVIQQGSGKNFCEFRRPAKARFMCDQKFESFWRSSQLSQSLGKSHYGDEITRINLR